MKLYRTTTGIYIERDSEYFLVPEANFDALVTHENLYAYLQSVAHGNAAPDFWSAQILAPIGTQEVWAAGVTYYRSRSARMEESKEAGGGSFYDRVYSAARPELFFKATGRRVVGPGAPVRIRSDAKWSVPEPELTLVVNAAGEIVGYTVGNDMSSRDIEGENPLYLPQAKVYDGSCALGPCVLVAQDPNELLARETAIAITIDRAGKTAFRGQTTLAELKRDPRELVEYLYRDNSFPQGALLLTGTGIVPGDDFTLATGDRIRITIDGIGTLENEVA